MDSIKHIKADEIFDNYEEFLRTFNDFCKDNYQPFIITTNNKRQVTIHCRHGYNRPSRSTGTVDLIFRSLAFLLMKRLESKHLSFLGLSTMGVLLLVVACLLPAERFQVSATGLAISTLQILARAFIGFFVVSTYVLQSEVFPTPLRATAFGVFSATGRIGAFLSSQVVALGTWTWNGLPFAILGACGIMAGIDNLFLPATRGKPMPSTIQDTLVLHKTLATGSNLGS